MVCSAFYSEPLRLTNKCFALFNTLVKDLLVIDVVVSLHAIYMKRRFALKIKKQSRTNETNE